MNLQRFDTPVLDKKLIQDCLNHDMFTGEDKDAKSENQQLHWGADVQEQL